MKKLLKWLNSPREIKPCKCCGSGTTILAGRDYYVPFCGWGFCFDCAKELNK